MYCFAKMLLWILMCLTTPAKAAGVMPSSECSSSKSGRCNITLPSYMHSERINATCCGCNEEMVKSLIITTTGYPTQPGSKTMEAFVEFTPGENVSLYSHKIQIHDVSTCRYVPTSFITKKVVLGVIPTYL
jgi:hypothetical protein